MLWWDVARYSRDLASERLLTARNGCIIPDDKYEFL